MVSPEVAELMELAARVPSSATSMKKLAIKLAGILQKDLERPEWSGNEAEFVATYRNSIQEVADWAAAGGDWQSCEDFGDMFARSGAWHNAMSFKKGEQYKYEDETVMEFPDGWRIVRLDPDNAKAEGSKMGHCVGSYQARIEQGLVDVYSLRDPNNEPHVTFNFRRKGQATSLDRQWEWDQIQGKEDAPPAEKYRPYLRQFAKVKREDVDPPSRDIKARMMTTEELLSAVRDGRLTEYTAFHNMSSTGKVELIKDHLSAGRGFDLLEGDVQNFLTREGGWRLLGPEPTVDVLTSTDGMRNLYGQELREIPGLGERISAMVAGGNMVAAIIALRTDLGKEKGLRMASEELIRKTLTRPSTSMHPMRGNARGTYIWAILEDMKSGKMDDRTLDNLYTLVEQNREAGLDLSDVLLNLRSVNRDAYLKYLRRILDDPTQFESSWYKPNKLIQPPLQSQDTLFDAEDFRNSGSWNTHKDLNQDIFEAEKLPRNPPRPYDAPQQNALFASRKILRTAMLAEELGVADLADRLEGML
jgi:hypothetical protein